MYHELSGYSFEDLKIGTKATVEKKRATLAIQCFVKDALVIDGEALVKVPSQSGT